MGYWKRHPKKDLERVLELLHRHGYTIIDPPTYYTLRCPCGQHQRQLHLTPSSQYHGNHVVRWAMKLPCWTSKDDEEGEES